MSVERILGAYLDAAGRLELKTLGPKGERGRASQEDTRRLQAGLCEERRSSRWMLIIMVGMLVLVFAGGLLTAVRITPRGWPFVGTAAGTITSLLLIVDRLRRLWVDSIVLAIATGGVQGWPPDKQLDLIELLYWQAGKKGGRVRRAREKPKAVSQTHR